MASEPPCKKASTMGRTIGTHNGTFHCDEALACFLLKQLPDYKDATVVRSRDPAVLDTCDVVVDVGGVYDPAKKRYDHHQRGFVETMHSLDATKKWTTKLISVGLVYVHHGWDVTAHTLGRKTSDPSVEPICDKVTRTSCRRSTPSTMTSISVMGSCGGPRQYRVHWRPCGVQWEHHHQSGREPVQKSRHP